MSARQFSKSRALMADAATLLPGGVSSNFRMSVSPTPLVIDRAEGAYVIDADGNRLIDYYLGMGPMILGHSPREVIAAAEAQLRKGILFAGQTAVEFEAARLVCDLVPCAERVRFAGSGSEAVQAALKLARAATGRHKILKFEGHYHGWLDSIHWAVAPDGRQPVQRGAGSPGQDDLAGANTEVLPWNDLAAVEMRLARGDIAGVIMEPAMCNASVIPPKPGYLEGVRRACTASGSVLIFDEVITGFRLAPGGASQYFGVTPDLTTLGKAIANGFPVAAVAGRADLMELFATGGVLQGGTYNAHPVGMAATVATLRALADGAVHRLIEQRTQALMSGIRAILESYQLPARLAGLPGVFNIAFDVPQSIDDYRGAVGRNQARSVAFATALLEHGVRSLERGTWFLSTEHTEGVIAQTLEAVDAAASRLRS